MKIHAACPVCFPGEGNVIQNRNCSADIKSTGVYYMTCPEGHEFYCIPMFEDYELLFEAGAYSLDSGNYVEAVSFFTNSLEKFRYFVILIADLQNQLPFDEIEKKRKILKLSERKIGAFYQAYSYIFKSSPDEFKNSLVKFRNEVIHEGKIPTYAEAKRYGIEVMDYIKEIQVVIRTTLPEDISLLPSLRFKVLEVQKKERELPIANPHTFQFMLDFINCVNNYENDFDTRFTRSKSSTAFLLSNRELE